VATSVSKVGGKLHGVVALSKLTTRSMSGMPRRHSRLRNRLRRAASGEQHEPASRVGFPTPTRPGLRAGRPSKRVVMRERTRVHETARHGGVS